MAASMKNTDNLSHIFTQVPALLRCQLSTGAVAVDKLNVFSVGNVGSQGREAGNEVSLRVINKIQSLLNGLALSELGLAARCCCCVTNALSTQGKLCP